MSKPSNFVAHLLYTGPEKKISLRIVEKMSDLSFVMFFLNLLERHVIRVKLHDLKGLTKEQLSNLWVTRATYQLGWALYLYIKVYFDMSNSY